MNVQETADTFDQRVGMGNGRGRGMGRGRGAIRQGGFNKEVFATLTNMGRGRGRGADNM